MNDWHQHVMYARGLVILLSLLALYSDYHQQQWLGLRLISGVFCYVSSLFNSTQNSAWGLFTLTWHIMNDTLHVVRTWILMALVGIHISG